MDKEMSNYEAMNQIMKEVLFYISESKASLNFMDRFMENMQPLQNNIMKILSEKKQQSGK